MFDVPCFMAIVGHKKILNFLNKSIEKDKISHAYLFVGPEHLGKFSVAFDFAKRITGGENKKVNPDIIIIKSEVKNEDKEKKEKEIKIEQIRSLEHNLSLSAYFGKYKVAIIDDADRLTVSAQNSLLKTLEEPQKKCVLILICHNAEKLLPTIKSRCLIKKFSLVSNDEISALIEDEKNKKEFIFWSQGLPGIAVKLQSEKKELEKRKQARTDLVNILDSNVSEKFEFCDNLSKNQKETIEILGFWVTLLREKFLGRDDSLKVGPEKSLKIISEIQKSIELAKETNSNFRLILENLFLKF